MLNKCLLCVDYCFYKPLGMLINSHLIFFFSLDVEKKSFFYYWNFASTKYYHLPFLIFELRGQDKNSIFHILYLLFCFALPFDTKGENNVELKYQFQRYNVII